MNIEAEVAAFGRDWEVDFSKLELRRRRFGIWRRVRELFWEARYPVLALYRWARKREDSFDAMSFPHIVNSDNLQPIPGLPTRFELNDGWSIPDHDLCSLIFGPLTKGKIILVPALPEKTIVLSLWQFITIFSTVGGAVGFVILLFGLI